MYPKITEVIVNNTVEITLDNGVTLNISPNKDYFHIHVSQIKLPMEIEPVSKKLKKNGLVCRAITANCFNVHYQTREEE